MSQERLDRFSAGMVVAAACAIMVLQRRCLGHTHLGTARIVVFRQR